VIVACILDTVVLGLLIVLLGFVYSCGILFSITIYCYDCLLAGYVVMPEFVAWNVSCWVLFTLV